MEARRLLSASLVADINPGTASSIPLGAINLGGKLFFAADDGIHGAEVCRSDGTAAGTVMVKDINPGAASSSPLTRT